MNDCHIASAARSDPASSSAAWIRKSKAATDGSPNKAVAVAFGTGSSLIATRVTMPRRCDLFGGARHNDDAGLQIVAMRARIERQNPLAADDIS